MKFGKIFFTLVVLGFSSRAFATNSQAQTFNLNGTLTDSSGTTPLLDSSVVVDIKILDPSKACVLYQERQTISTSSTQGNFSLQIGSTVGAGKRYGSDPGNGMATVYQNQTAPAVGGCGGYTPASGDVRYVRVTVTPSSTGVADTFSPDLTLGSVPSANVADNAVTLQGLAPSQFVQMGSATNLTQANVNQLFGTGWTNIQNVINGQFVQAPANGTVLITNQATNPSPGLLAKGDIWFNSSTNTLNYYDGSVVKTVVEQSGTGLTLNASSITSGTIGGSTAINTTGNVQAANVSATTSSTNNFKLYNTASTHSLLLTVPSGMAADYSLQLPPTDGSNGQVLSTNGAGVLSWTTAGGGGSQWTTNGANIYYPSGNVGIGMPNPMAALDVNGSVRVAYDPQGCSPSIGGAIRYNASLVEYCNGSAWQPLSGGGGGTLSTAGGTMTGQLNGTPGMASMPSYAFNGDNGTGFYDVSPGTIGISSFGMQTFTMSSTSIAASMPGGAQIGANNGTATMPTYSFSGDSGLGWFRPMTGNLAASTGGLERIRIDQNGNIGIGTTSPIAPFHLMESGNADTIVSSQSGTPELLLTGGSPSWLGVGLQYIGNSFQVTSVTNGSPSSYPWMNVNGSNGHFAMTSVQSNPLVMDLQRENNISPVPVGMPLARVAFNGWNGTAFSTSAAAIEAQSAEAFTPSANGANLLFYTTPMGTSAPIERMRIDQGGNLGIGTTMPMKSLHIAGSMPQTGIQIQNMAGGGNFALNVNNSGPQPMNGFTIYDQNMAMNRLVIDQTGNVGIGTSMPAATLDVMGGLNVNSPGGQAITLNANGAANINLNATGGKINLGTQMAGGQGFTAMGSCQIPTPTGFSTTSTSYTCNGVPSGPTAIVNCSPTTALSTGAGVICRGTGTANQIQCISTAVVSPTTTWNCMWMIP